MQELKAQGRTRSKRHRLTSLAVGALLVAALFGLLRLGHQDPLAPSTLAKALTAKGGIPISRSPTWFAPRRSQQSSVAAMEYGRDRWFLVGVRTLDLEVALRMRQVGPARTLSRQLAGAMSDLSDMGELAAGYDQLAEKLETHRGQTSTQAGRIGSRLTEMTARAASRDELSFSFGLWCEAGRLAGLSSNVDLLTSRSFREFLSRLDERRNWHPKVAVEIERLRDLLRPELNDLQVAAIAVSFEAIVALG